LSPTNDQAGQHGAIDRAAATQLKRNGGELLPAPAHVAGSAVRKRCYAVMRVRPPLRGQTRIAV